MIETVEVRTSSGALLTLSFQDIVAGYMVEDIRGLDPVTAVLVSSSFAGMDGTQYQSSRREERDLIFTIALEPDFDLANTVRELRTHLYDFFMPKSEVTLHFTLEDELEVDVKGRVKSFETSIFTKEPAVDITIVCNDPDFVDPEPVVINGSTVNTTTETVINYDGTVETGIELVLNVNRSLSEFTIYHRPPDGTVRTFDFEGALVAGDVLRISTVVGNKYVTLTRGGTTTSLLYGKSPQSNWTEFQKGANGFRVYALGAAIPYTVTYTTRYGGL